MTDPKLPQQKQEWLEAYLDERRSEVEAHVPCRVRPGRGHSAGTLIRQAQEEEVDLILLTSHGRSGGGDGSASAIS